MRGGLPGPEGASAPVAHEHRLCARRPPSKTRGGVAVESGGGGEGAVPTATDRDGGEYDLDADGAGDRLRGPETPRPLRGGARQTRLT